MAGARDSIKQKRQGKAIYKTIRTIMRQCEGAEQEEQFEVIEREVAECEAECEETEREVTQCEETV